MVSGSVRARVVEEEDTVREERTMILSKHGQSERE